MRDRMESSERELKIFEAEIEQIENFLELIEHSIDEIEATMSRLEGEGDKEVAAALQKSLAEKKQEKADKEREAQEVAQKLDQISNEVQVVKGWNKNAHQEIASLEKLDVSVDEAANRIADRERWVQEQDSRCRDLKQRLSRLTGGGGFG